MALHRLRARMRFPTSSGMAVWARDNMAVRYQQAVHINEGAANLEPKRNEVIDEVDGEHQQFVCDLPLLDEAHAADAFDTLTAASVTAWAVAFPSGPEGETIPGYVEHHTCHHDESPVQPCAIVSRQEVLNV